MLYFNDTKTLARPFNVLWQHVESFFELCDAESRTPSGIHIREQGKVRPGANENDIQEAWNNCASEIDTWYDGSPESLQEILASVEKLKLVWNDPRYEVMICWDNVRITHPSDIDYSAYWVQRRVAVSRLTRFHKPNSVIVALPTPFISIDDTFHDFLAKAESRLHFRLQKSCWRHVTLTTRGKTVRRKITTWS